jgi:hypothetical protein
MKLCLAIIVSLRCAPTLKVAPSWRPAGPRIRLKEVEEAQQAMITTAKDLADGGEIVIGGGSGDDEVVFMRTRTSLGD